MTVYIEYVFLYNLIIDIIILKATLTLNGIKAKKGRLFLCAFFLALIPFLPFISFNKFLSPIIKVCFGIIIFNLFFIKNKKKAKPTLSFLGVTLLFGGLTYFVSSVLKIDYLDNLFLAFLPLIFLVLFYVLRFIYFSIKNDKKIEKITAKVNIKIGKVALNVNGIVDTGNETYYAKTPVIFCSKKLGEKFLCQMPLPIIKKISVSTINGENTLPIIKSETLKVYFDKKDYSYSNVWVCVAPKTFSGFDIILHPDYVSKGD